MKAGMKFISLVATTFMSIGTVHAAETSSGPVLGDTMIFSLFVVTAILFLFVIYGQVNALRGILENRDILDKSKKGNSGPAATVILGLIFLSQSAQAAAGTTSEPVIVMTDELFWTMIALNAFLLGIILTLYFITKGIVRAYSGKEEEEDVITQLTASLTDAVPIEREGEIMMDHNYDGIRELDNNLPPWWKYGFYVSIIFSVFYLIHYHVTRSGDLQLAEYQKQVAEAEELIAAFRANQANNVDESNLMALTESDRLESGKQVFIDNCQICHGAKGEGLVGPNFTDKYWKHGGGIKNIYNTIKVGVPDKGMISWESQLTPGQMHEVASYILTMEGTNPPNQKAPEGELWEETAAEPAAGDSLVAPATDSTDTAMAEEGVM